MLVASIVVTVWGWVYIGKEGSVAALVPGILNTLLFFLIVWFLITTHKRAVLPDDTAAVPRDGEAHRTEDEIRQSLIVLDYAYKELQAAHDELKIANEKAMEADRLKSEFIANMSHELRTPLNSVIALSQILLVRMDGDLTEEQEKQVSIIQKSGRHLLELINDILDLSKIEAGKMEVNIEEFPIEEVLNDVMAIIKPMAAEKGHDVALAIDEGIGIIRSDRNKLKQILLNLLSNAVKFTPKGGKIAIDIRHRDGTVELTVSDTGIGIVNEDMDKIFHEFTQVDGSSTREYGGTGLGLAITKRLVNLLGGEIGVESRPGNGSIFTVTIPMV